MRISDWSSDVCSSDLALDGAFALAQIDDIAVSVAQHLNLDVARPLDELLDEHAVVAEAGLGLVPHRLEGVAHVLFAIGKAHALAAAACRRLHHHRIDEDRQSDGKGKSVSVSVDHGGSCISKQKNNHNH